MKKEFNFTWAALNLLGKSLYSNAWAAISELVANGLDAKATRVSVFIDARTKTMRQFRSWTMEPACVIRR